VQDNERDGKGDGERRDRSQADELPQHASEAWHHDDPERRRTHLEADSVVRQACAVSTGSTGRLRFERRVKTCISVSAAVKIRCETCRSAARTSDHDRRSLPWLEKYAQSLQTARPAKLPTTFGVRSNFAY
jgi:hypothetical protein